MSTMAWVCIGIVVFFIVLCIVTKGKIIKGILEVIGEILD